MKTAAVILSGCGVFDGAEIHESVLTLLALDRANALIVCAAPDIPREMSEALGEMRQRLGLRGRAKRIPALEPMDAPGRS